MFNNLTHDALSWQQLDVSWVFRLTGAEYLDTFVQVKSERLYEYSDNSFEVKDSTTMAWLRPLQQCLNHSQSQLTCDRQLLYWHKSQNEEKSEETSNLNNSHGQARSCSKTIQSSTRLAARLIETIRTRAHLGVSAIIIMHKNIQMKPKMAFVLLIDSALSVSFGRSWGY